QKILRRALARAGLVEGYEHVCRWCGHNEHHADNEQRYCPKCLKRTNGTGKLLAQPRGRALWRKAIPRPMRFHDLRHTTATLLLRAGVDAHRVQRLLRHRDVRTTTGFTATWMSKICAQRWKNCLSWVQIGSKWTLLPRPTQKTAPPTSQTLK